VATAKRDIDGFEGLVLAGEIEATFVPSAGMVGCSLRHRGDELLGQRGGLRRYAEERKTMGIPLLYPWANRLASERFSVAGRQVDVAGTRSRDRNGLPIHGLLAGDGGWQVERFEDDTLVASFDLGRRPDLLAAFPFPHLLRIEASVTGSSLTIVTTLEANADAPVPVAFGFHPYLQLSGVPRADWEIEVPVRERLVLDDHGIPTGEREPAAVAPGPLGDRTFDDAFTAPDGPFTLSGGGRTIAMTFEDGYPDSQLYAPPDDDVVAFEPMTAPTNALVTNNLRVLEPGEQYSAAFSIDVQD
jgi:galactose mutarotase-like enzyme